MLYLISQRYKFESESQQNATILNAVGAVFNKSKIEQGERKTSKFTCVFCRAAAYLLERYKFESESQHKGCEFSECEAVFNKSKIEQGERKTNKFISVFC